MPFILEDAENNLPMLARRLLHDLYLRLQGIHTDVLAYDREWNTWPKTASSPNS